MPPKELMSLFDSGERRQAVEIVAGYDELKAQLLVDELYKCSARSDADLLLILIGYLQLDRTEVFLNVLKFYSMATFQNMHGAVYRALGRDLRPRTEDESMALSLIIPNLCFLTGMDLISGVQVLAKCGEGCIPYLALMLGAGPSSYLSATIMRSLRENSLPVSRLEEHIKSELGSGDDKARLEAMRLCISTGMSVYLYHIQDCTSAISNSALSFEEKNAQLALLNRIPVNTK